MFTLFSCFTEKCFIMIPRFCLYESTFKKCVSHFTEVQCTISACAAIFLLNTYSFGELVLYFCCVLFYFSV